MINRFIIFLIVLTAPTALNAQKLFLLSKKQDAKAKDYVYEEGNKLVIGINGEDKRRIGVFHFETDTTLGFNDTLISLTDIDYVLVKRGWSERVAQMGFKWGITYFLTFAINDWFRTGNPFDNQYTLPNSAALISIGAIAVLVSLKKCRSDDYNYFLIE